MSNETAARGIHAATLAVMKEVGVIEKTRRNEKQNYQFRGIDDVVERVGPLMVKHGITCSPRVLSFTPGFVDSNQGKPMPHVFVLVEYTYRAADGSSEVVTTLGEAMDSGDKASFKAMSGALKYAHTQYFEIPTFGAKADPESDSPELAQRSAAAPATRPASRPAQTSNAAPRAAQTPSGGRSGTLNFPPYGRAKGTPISGADLQTLQFYKSGAERSLADPAKSNFHAKERALLEAIEAEIAAQTGGTQPHDNDEPPPHTDSDAF